MSLVLTPNQIDISNIRYLPQNNTINIIYKDPLFTTKSIDLLIHLRNGLSNKKYIPKTDLLPLIQLEYNILQKNKTNTYPIYTIKDQIYNNIKTTKLSFLYIHITGIWQQNNKCGLIYNIE
jgi:hypothetical protein